MELMVHKTMWLESIGPTAAGRAPGLWSTGLQQRESKLLQAGKTHTEDQRGRAWGAHPAGQSPCSHRANWKTSECVGHWLRRKVPLQERGVISPRRSTALDPPKNPKCKT